MRRKRNHQGILHTPDRSLEEKNYVVNTLAGTPETLVHNPDVKQLIVDCGETTHATGWKEDFIEGSLEKLETPVYMDGISGRIPATHIVITHYEFVTDDGKREIFEEG